jgi:hypothetical protein
MTIDEFWTIIESADEGIMVDTLCKRSEQDIIDFERHLRERIIECDHYHMVAALRIINDYVSDDSYLYFRCWVVAHGRSAFENALQNADSVCDVLEDGEFPDREELLYVATRAFEIKTGRSEDTSFPRDICISNRLDYDFNAPPTKGSDFRDEDLPAICPRLWERFAT